SDAIPLARERPRQRQLAWRRANAAGSALAHSCRHQARIRAFSASSVTSVTVGVDQASFVFRTHIVGLVSGPHCGSETDIFSGPYWGSSGGLHIGGFLSIFVVGPRMARLPFQASAATSQACSNVLMNRQSFVGMTARLFRAWANVSKKR